MSDIHLANIVLREGKVIFLTPQNLNRESWLMIVEGVTNVAAQQSVHLTAYGAGWLARFGHWLVGIGFYLCKIGGR